MKSEVKTVSIGHIEINPELFNEAPNPDDLPVLATRNLVLFPGVSIPISLTREMSLTLARRAADEHFPVGIVCQADPNDDSPSVTTGLLRYGVVADIFQVIELPDGSHTAIVRARDRIRIMGRGLGQLVPGALSARIKVLTEGKIRKQSEFNNVMDAVTELSSELAQKSDHGDHSFASTVKMISSPIEKLNFIATNVPIEAAAKVDILSERDPYKRADLLLTHLVYAQQKIDTYEEIIERARGKMGENQRSAFLQSQMEAIREELYGEDADEDADKLQARADKLDMSDAAREAFDRQLTKLRRLNPSTPDYSVEYAYLDTLLDLPWSQEETINDFENAEMSFESHYGLEKVKDRILDQLAVIINHPKRLVKMPILCLVGPPGVGKTSLGKSIAEALDRQYQRVSLGGVHDEAEIRGHRRTYIGAMPGRIIKAMKEAKFTNPVIVLDEVDKLGRDHRGDPSSALLEVLDPEQNSKFHDNYIDVDYDLSRVLFIATANTTATIDPPLLDRMEVIEIPGYTLEEKVEIAKQHLIEKVKEACGLTGPEFDLKITDETISAIIEGYTAESGVRQLEKNLGTIVRKYVRSKVSGKPFPNTIEPAHLKELLGLPKFNKDKYEGNDFPGVVTGLAWTQVGGEILLAEASLSAGKGEKLSLTGNLGDVMKESATIALQWVKSNAESLGIDPEKFEKNNLHVHFPEGAIPKDGPSAGITITTAITSAFTGRKVKPRIAMTGEMTLRGRVLPVGGIREKILAAKRAGIDTIILSSENRRDIDEIPARYLDGLNFVYVDNARQVIDAALL